MSTRPCATRLALLALMALAAPGSRSEAQNGASADRYKLIVLPATTRASSVNALGRITGVTGLTTSSAFVWSRGTGLVPLAPVAGYPSSFAEGLNRAGFVAGTSFSPALNQATLWTPSGTALPISVPGATQSTARAVNNAGVVLLGAQVSGQWSGWVWDAVNGARALSTFGLPTNSYAVAINRSSQIVGGQPWGQAWRLDLATSTLIHLGTLGGEYSSAYDVNDAGHVIGWAHGPFNYDTISFLWTPSTGMKPLSGSVKALNDDDDVVGSFEVQPGVSHAFVHDRVTGFHDLNDLVPGGPIELTEAIDISNTDWIVGKGVDHSAGNAQVAFVLKPR